jgi:hypothetical protein
VPTAKGLCGSRSLIRPSEVGCRSERVLGADLLDGPLLPLCPCQIREGRVLMLDKESTVIGLSSDVMMDVSAR